MSLPRLFLMDARHPHLVARSLLKKIRRRATPADIPATILRVSPLQISAIDTVARSPYLILFSRLGDYSLQWLDDSLQQDELTEYWTHEACFLPRSDFALIRHRMLALGNMG